MTAGGRGERGNFTADAVQQRDENRLTDGARYLCTALQLFCCRCVCAVDGGSCRMRQSAGGGGEGGGVSACVCGDGRRRR